MAKVQELYIYLDDSGKLNSNDRVCVYGGLVFLSKKEKDSTYGNDFDYQQAMNEVLLSMNFCEMFGLNRKNVFSNVKVFKMFKKAIKRARNIITEFKPDIVIGTGGYVCFPIFKVATKLKIPTMLHESNAFPGLSVKVAAKGAAKVFLGFDDAKKRLGEGVNCVYTGTPAKFDMDHMMHLDKDECKEKLNLNKKYNYVGFASRIEKDKGYDVYLRFIKELEKMVKKDK